MNRLITKFTTGILMASLLVACKTVPQRKTVASLDKSGSAPAPTEQQNNVTRSTDEIRKAYWKYLENTSASDSSRQLAISRLAELEFEVSKTDTPDASEDKLDENFEANYNLRQLEKSISLYQLSLRDYPKAKGNDNLLYQLAKAQDQIGRVEESFQNLLTLTIEYPKSTHYVESQFRIGEYQFIRADYAEAERAYTEVIVSPKNSVFLEKALFKRGWARFKQSFYDEAIEDFEAAISVHNFGDINKLETTEREQFDEYFRAMGLSFANLGGAVPLKDYFSNNPNFPFIYHTYSVISDIYLSQERFSDASRIMEAYKVHYPNSSELPIAHNKIVNIWRKSGYKEKLFPTIDSFYLSYNKRSAYWKNNTQSSKNKTIVDKSLRENLLLTAQYFHSEYQKNQSPSNFDLANKWYSRYLLDYTDNAKSDKIHTQYAQLLHSKGKIVEALTQYELAAFDGELILDKNAAYQSIILSHQLYKKLEKGQQRSKQSFLQKQIDYTLRYSRIYSDDKDLEVLISNAAKSAYDNLLFDQVIELTNGVTISKSSNANQDIALLKAQAHFQLKDYEAAESAYQYLISNSKLSKSRRTQLSNRLALSIYEQGRISRDNKEFDEANFHFMRIADSLPHSDIASTGLYDAIALMIENEKWQESVSAISKFQSLFPKHRLSGEVTKKLSVAYLKLNQGSKAAQQFEKISKFEQDRNTKMAALWQAAQLYREQNDTAAAARAYSKFANTYRKPFAQNMEALRSLVEIYQETNNKKLRNIWRNRIIKADKNTSGSDKTERTSFIAALTLLEIAKEHQAEFNQQTLKAPFRKSLKRKKKSLQKAVELYGRASSYGIPEITTESTFSIASLYADFSQSLLNSERPTHLNEEELEQYNILLEDQAYPFEDKAIEFHEINLSRINEGIFDQWVTLSLVKLKQLFPTKYARKSKIDGVIRTIK